MKPIFISRPTVIATKYNKPYLAFEAYLRRSGLLPKRLGSGQFTMDAPLKGVIALMNQCSGAIILGYPQYEIAAHIKKADDAVKGICMTIPTPWNQIEATLAFYKRLPVLVIAHTGVSGGVFDCGVTGQFVLNLDLSANNWHKLKEFKGVFKEWKMRIR